MPLTAAAQPALAHPCLPSCGGVSAPFAEAMAAAGPFEREPWIAVAVSGGADSMALALVAQVWVQHRGGRISALTVDHGLRAGSDQEAASVARWMAARGIEHIVLRWEGEKPVAGIQATARAARYRLLDAWCRQQGVLHLLLGHHRRDQAETVLMRERRSGEDSEPSAMTRLVTTPSIRLIRPLLDLAPEVLKLWLRTRGQPWIEDPSNLDPRFERVRVRSRIIAEPNLGEDALIRARRGQQRDEAVEPKIRRLLAGACRLHPAGFARIDRGHLAAETDGVAHAALRWVLTTISGRPHGPGWPPLRRFARRFDEAPLGFSATLHRCRVIAEREDLLVVRECRNLPPPRRATPGRAIRWDGRFRLEVGAAVPAGSHIAALGNNPLPVARPIPAAARCGLPVLVFADGAHAVATLGPLVEPNLSGLRAVYEPARTLSGMGRFLADEN